MDNELWLKIKVDLENGTPCSVIAEKYNVEFVRVHAIALAIEPQDAPVTESLVAHLRQIDEARAQCLLPLFDSEWRMKQTAASLQKLYETLSEQHRTTISDCIEASRFEEKQKAIETTAVVESRQLPEAREVPTEEPTLGVEATG